MSARRETMSQKNSAPKLTCEDIRLQLLFDLSTYECVFDINYNTLIIWDNFTFEQQESHGNGIELEVLDYRTIKDILSYLVILSLN